MAPLNFMMHFRNTIFQERYLPLFGALFAAVVAAWVNYQAKGVINNDGILYVEVARLFTEDAWQKGLETYNWPFYPLLIMLVHKLSGLEYQLSASLLSVLFFAITGMGVAVLIRELGGTRQTVAAGLVLLIATPYLAGDIVPMVVREHGYWACHIWSLIYFLRFMSDRSLKHAIGWGVLAVGCVLFRIEGLTYLFGVPLLLLADNTQSVATRFRSFLKANGLILLLGFGLLIIFLMDPTLGLRDMGRLHEPFTIAELVYQQLTTGLAMRAEKIAQYVLGSYLDDYAMPMLLAGLIYILFAKALTVGGVLQTGLALILWQRIRTVIHRSHLQFLGLLLLLTMVNAAVILVKGFILPKRIFSPMAFIVIILAAFGLTLLLADIQSKFTERKQWRWIVLVVVGVILVMQLWAVLKPSHPQKRYERDAVEWVMSEASERTRIYFQTERLRFYAGHPLKRGDDWLTIQESRWRKALEVRHSDGNSSNHPIDPGFVRDYDYFVFSLKRNSDREGVLNATFGQPLNIFNGPRGNRVLIYRPSMPSK
jgi:hypothetical protein